MSAPCSRPFRPPRPRALTLLPRVAQASYLTWGYLQEKVITTEHPNPNVVPTVSGLDEMSP